MVELTQLEESERKATAISATQSVTGALSLSERWVLSGNLPAVSPAILLSLGVASNKIYLAKIGL